MFINEKLHNEHQLSQEKAVSDSRERLKRETQERELRERLKRLKRETS